MVIGIDIRVLTTGRTTGIEEYTRHLLDFLFDCDPGTRFKLFRSGRGNVSIPDGWLTRKNVTCVNVRRSNRWLMATTAVSGRPYLDRLVGGADVFFFPHFLIGGVSPACRRVVTFHDLSFERFPHLFSAKRRLWHALQRPRWQASKADRIIAVSGSTRDDLVRLYRVSAGRIATIHSGIDPALRDQRTLFPDRQGMILLVLCAMEERKNIAGAITAFELLKVTGRYAGLKLVLAGSAAHGERDMAAHVKRSPWVGDITRISSFSPTDRQRLYATAAVFLYPSFFEGFGFPPLEAMACGIPVVTSATSSIPEVVGDAALLVNPSDAQQVASAVGALLDDRQLIELMRMRGLERVRQFSWQRAAEKTMSVLYDAVREPSPHAVR